MLQRRDVLKLAFKSAAGSAALLSSGAFGDDKPAAAPAPAPAPSPPSPPPAPVAGPGIILGQPTNFASGIVNDLAKKLAQEGFKPVGTDLPDPFKSLSYEQYTAIHLKSEARIWADKTLGFVVEPLHRGFQFNNLIELNLVADGKAYPLLYDVKLFDFGKLNPSPKIGNIGFSGFRVLGPQGKSGQQEIATFQGTNFFHAAANGQVAGLIARALAIRIADSRGEEMPVFRSIWIEKPGPTADFLVVHALIDSNDVTGAFHFTIRPGEATIIDTECSLYPRNDVDNYGLATMSGTHLLGFLDHKKFDDYRPNVSEVCGVQLLMSSGEWVWRPVSNRDTLQISTFGDNKPQGFGCLIRDRDFEDYDDEEQHWERRPSLWIEPLSDWSEGGLQLIEIPSQSENNDNILCLWKPKAPLKKGTEAFFSYRQFWCWDPPTRPDLARAMRTRAGSSGKRRRFFVEFRGDILADEARTSGMSPTLTAGNGAITFMRSYADPGHKAYRVLFELDPGNADSSEIRLLLQAKGKPVSETWLYRWTPV